MMDSPSLIQCASTRTSPGSTYSSVASVSTEVDTGRQYDDDACERGPAPSSGRRRQMGRFVVGLDGPIPAQTRIRYMTDLSHASWRPTSSRISAPPCIDSALAYRSRLYRKVFMSAQSAIEWTETTWNPTTGCDRVSAGCDNCYALALAKRLKAMGKEKYANDGDPRTSGPGFAVTTHQASLNMPRAWKKPRMVFVNSMSDLFHAKVSISFIQDVFEVMRETPQHTYQVLTKRASRLARLSEQINWPTNVWMGVSVEDKKAIDRIEHLRTTGAAIKFVSAEPLLEDLGQIDLVDISWLIAGGESGPAARSINGDWIRNLRDQCIDARVAFFFKQWGGRTPKSGGRELDGQLWSQFPQR